MSAFSDHILSLAPILYLRLNEAAGGPLDLAGNHAEGSYNGSIDREQTGLTGDGDTCVRVAGTSSSNNIGVPSSSLLSGASGFTVNLFWQRELTGIAHTLLDWSPNASTDYVRVSKDSNDRPSIYVANTTAPGTGQHGWYTQTAPDLSAGDMLTVCYDGAAGLPFFYVNGVEVPYYDAGGASPPANLPTGNVAFTLARGAQGRHDDYTVWDRVLTPAEITGIYDLATGGGPQPVEARSFLFVDTRARSRGRAYLKIATAAPVVARCYLKADTAAVRARAYLKVGTRAGITARAMLRVDTATDYSVAQRPGVNWSLRLLIDGIDQTHLLTGTVRTDWSAGKSFVANFDLMPQDGTLDPADYDRRPVVLEYRDEDSAGAVQFALRRYAGTISGVTWLPAQAILRCSATTNSDARFRAMDQDRVGAEIGGEWSPYVFNRSARGWDHARDRLETLQADLWFKPDGGVLLKPWASAAPAVQWQGGDVLPDSLRHEPALTSQITNRIEVRLDYRFERLRQRMIRCRWSTGVSWCERLINPFPLCQRAMIESAAGGAGGWQLLGDVWFEPIAAPGAYRCFPFAPGSASKYILWGGDADDAWAWSASWTVGRRWAQDITERYTAEVIAGASVDANGLLQQVDEYGVQSEKDNSDWLAQEAYSEAGAGFLSIGSSAPAGDGVGTVLGDQVMAADEDGPGNRADFEQAQRAAFAAAAAEIVRSHRHTVTAANLFDPRIKPGLTLRIDTLKLQATGHVVAIREVFDLEAGRALSEVDIGPFVVGGSGVAAPTPLEPIAQPATGEESDIPEKLYFGTRIGGLTSSPLYNPEWTGYTTNYEHDATAQDPFAADPIDIGDRHYPNQFAVEYPEITGAHLQAIELQAQRRLDVVIPDDELVRVQ